MFLKKIHYFYIFTSCLHGLSDAFYVLASIVVLYYGIARYFSLSGSQAEYISTEDISTEDISINSEGFSSSLRMECS